MMFKVATWNVNSIKVRLDHILQWLEQSPVDVLAIQETKSTDENFPREALEAAGYHVAFSGQKTYNGMAIISRHPIDEVVTDNPDFEDPQRRILAATINGVRIINLYVPNGQSVGSDKYAYKLQWLASMRGFIQAQMQAYPRLLVLGDFNIAPADADVHDPIAWEGHVLVSPDERQAFADLLACDLTDAFRIFTDEAGHFSWWDYRQAAFRRNRGMRIDHILLSADLVTICDSCTIDKTPRGWERPSDHTPVIVALKA
jgi:exodeoxyribonuclease III